MGSKICLRGGQILLLAAFVLLSFARPVVAESSSTTTLSQGALLAKNKAEPATSQPHEESSREHLSTCLKEKPRDTECRWLLAKSLLAEGQLEAAMGELVRLREIDHQYPALQRTIKHLRSKLGWDGSRPISGLVRDYAERGDDFKMLKAFLAYRLEQLIGRQQFEEKRFDWGMSKAGAAEFGPSEDLLLWLDSRLGNAYIFNDRGNLIEVCSPPEEIDPKTRQEGVRADPITQGALQCRWSIRYKNQYCPGVGLSTRPFPSEGALIIGEWLGGTGYSIQHDEAYFFDGQRFRGPISWLQHRSECCSSSNYKIETEVRFSSSDEAAHPDAGVWHRIVNANEDKPYNSLGPRSKDWHQVAWWSWDHALGFYVEEPVAP